MDTEMELKLGLELAMELGPKFVSCLSGLLGKVF